MVFWNGALHCTLGRAVLCLQDPAPRPLWSPGLPAFLRPPRGTCLPLPQRPALHLSRVSIPGARSPPAAPHSFRALRCGFMRVPVFSAGRTHQRGFQMLRAFTPTRPGNDTMLLNWCQVHFLTKELCRSIFGVSASATLERHHLPRAPPPGQSGNDLRPSGRSVLEISQMEFLVSVQSPPVSCFL